MTLFDSNWLLLIVSLPANAATTRMRIWRAVKMLGCVALRDGAYLIPQGDERAAQLAKLAADTNREGGTGWLLHVNPTSANEHALYAALFDRAEDYAQLLTSIAEARACLSTLPVAEQARAVRKLRREYEAVQAIDFFPGDAATRAQDSWTDFLRYAEASSGGEPRSMDASVARLSPEAYRGRTWATRRRPWVDRVASAWLIRRFIDPQATLLWLESPVDCPPDALGYDFDGATFSHIGDKVTFEVLCASFGFDQNPGLALLGRMVHFLDVGGTPVAAAGGFEAMLDGTRERIADDDQLLAEMSGMLDSLYVHFSRTKGEPA